MSLTNWKGILVVDKDLGISSFAVVARLRKILRIKKIGHCGTLDPFATGVLPISIGRATAAIRFMENYDKVYTVEAILGEATDSMDHTGSVIEKTEMDLQTLYKSGKLHSILQTEAQKLSGDILQTPPMYSAIKIDGKRLYDLARQGIEVERKARPVSVKILDFTGPYPCKYQDEERLAIRVSLEVSKGTYIRSWIDDLGRNSGVFAFCQSLRRIRCGPYTLEKALSTEELFDIYHDLADDPLKVRDYLDQQGIALGIETAFPQFSRFYCNKEEASGFLHGRALPVDRDTIYKRVGKEEDLFSAESSFLLFYQEHCLGMASLKTVGNPNEKESSYLIKTERVWADHDDLFQ